ncbi:integrase [Palaeococcus ferrophilus]|uniref:integrase n=1 Tax=Palaeococcus ferrophilus TaxID=83868 RepID=UPI00147707EC|nr:integrase [Palaeococcus ferrophilus]
MARRNHCNGEVDTSQTAVLENEPPHNVFTEEALTTKKHKSERSAYLNELWRKYKEEFKVYMDKQVKEGKLSKARFKDYWNGLNRFFKNHKINEAIDFLSIDHIPDSQVKGLKKFFKFLLDFKYKEIDMAEIQAMNRQVKVKSSPKMEGKPADEKTMKAIIENLEKEKDYRYYLYLTLIYTGGRASQILNLLRDIGAGTVKKYEDFGDVVAFDITKYGKGKKKGFFAIMPKWLGDELLKNKDLFKDMPLRTSNMRFLKNASKEKAGASNIRDWFFNKAFYELKGNRTMINFIQSRNDEKGAWQNYVNIKQALEGAVKEYKKLMEKGMFAFLS